VHEHGGDCHAEFTAVGGAPGLPGVRTCGLSVRRAGGAGDRFHVRSAVRPALAAQRAGDRGVDRREDLEVPVEAGDRQDSGHLRRRRGQAQESAEQPGAAPGAHEDAEAAGVGDQNGVIINLANVVSVRLSQTDSAATGQYL
jgi:hypothetical protein